MRLTSLMMCSLLVAGCPARSPGGDDDTTGDGGIPTGECADITEERGCAARTDCVVDICFNCTCTPSFAGCRTPDAPPTGCPELGCAMPECCNDDTDCSNASCVPPGVSPGCGACYPDETPCMRDSDCLNSGTGTDMICDVHPCSCFGGLSCLKGCSSADECAEGEACADDHRCVPTRCDRPADCPAHFNCRSGQCQRVPCMDDSGCEGGFCVSGACYDGMGVCMLPVP